MIKVAAIQMNSQQDVHANLHFAAQAIKQAAENGAELICLPEMFACMGVDQQALPVVEAEGNGPIQDFLSKQARRHQIYLIGGTLPLRTTQKEKSTASCLLYSPQGDRIARYDKIHLFDVNLANKETYHESNTIEAGNQAVVVDTPLGKIGLAVCYDLRFPELFKLLRLKGADIIALPAAFTQQTGQAHWHCLTQARAIETQCFFIAACQTGKHANDRQTYGHSVILDPWGQTLAQAEQIPGIIITEINRQTLETIRQQIPLTQHQRITLTLNSLSTCM